MQKTCFFFFLFLLGVVLSAQSAFIDGQTSPNRRPGLAELGPEWELSFSDEFEGNSLKTNRWNRSEPKANGSGRSRRNEIGITWWDWNPNYVGLSGGRLELESRKTAVGRMECGAINSQGKWEQTYGYYEARIRIADKSKGTHTAFWLNADGMTSGGISDDTLKHGRDGAEIDVFESAYPNDRTSTNLHHDHYKRVRDPAFVKDDISQGWRADGMLDNMFHTYGLLWTPMYLKIYYDGNLMATFEDTKYVPAVDEFLLLSVGAAFGFADRPQDVTFTTEPVDPDNALTTAYVNWLRVWKLPNDDYSCFVNSYELKEEDTSSTLALGGATLEESPNGNPSGLQHVLVRATGPGQGVAFEVCAPEDGNYDLNLGSILGPNRGIYEASIGLGGGQNHNFQNINMYRSGWGSGPTDLNLGRVYLNAGKHTVRFRNAGKVSASGNFLGSFDKLELTLVNGANNRSQNHLADEIPALAGEFSVNDRELSLFPNPAGDRFSLTGTAGMEIEGVDLLSVEGRLVHRYRVAPGPTSRFYSLPADLKPGVYLVRVSTLDDWKALRLVVR